MAKKLRQKDEIPNPAKVFLHRRDWKTAEKNRNYSKDLELDEAETDQLTMGDFSQKGPTWRRWPSMNQEAVSGARFERQKLYAPSS